MGAGERKVENMVDFAEVLGFYKDKRVLVTGHTGFKGTWLWTLLQEAGAQCWGFSLSPTLEPNLFQLCGYDQAENQSFCDIADFQALKQVFEAVQPEIVLHLAAQPLVSVGYEEPMATYQTNVMGTVHLLECCRLFDCVKSVVNVTTDKVYENKEWVWGYREQENLDGFDPYSNSKSCSELVTASYKRSFFSERSVSTVRAGNVIGGGDFSPKRIIPDCVEAAVEKKAITVRNPRSMRPYQHVLDGLFVYLMVAKEQYENREKAGAYNVGPEEEDCITTGTLVDLFCKAWGEGQEWHCIPEENPPHEAHFLKLDSSLLKREFQWESVWNVKKAVEMTCQWAKVWQSQGDVHGEMREEIHLFLKEQKNKSQMK